MIDVFQELPLALFTTFAPIGAGAFSVFALLVNLFSTSKDARKSYVYALCAPLVLVFVGFAASVFHLANPVHMPYVVLGIGTSPLSNEIAVGGVFLVLAIVFCVLAARGVLNETQFCIFARVVGVAALVFSIFIGFAYMISTVHSWSTPFNSVQMLGYSLVGGVCLVPLMRSIAVRSSRGALTQEHISSRRLCIAAGLGVAAILVGLLGQVWLTASYQNALQSGIDLANHAVPFLLACIVLTCVALVLSYRTRVHHCAFFTILPCAVVVLSVFAGRLAFYAMHISVGIFL